MTPSDLARLESMSEAERLELAKKYRDAYWSGAWRKRPEDERIDALNHACVVICCGDKVAGLKLSREALWS